MHANFDVSMTVNSMVFEWTICYVWSERPARVHIMQAQAAIEYLIKSSTQIIISWLWRYTEKPRNRWSSIEENNPPLPWGFPTSREASQRMAAVSEVRIPNPTSASETCLGSLEDRLRALAVIATRLLEEMDPIIIPPCTVAEKIQTRSMQMRNDHSLFRAGIYCAFEGRLWSFAGFSHEIWNSDSAHYLLRFLYVAVICYVVALILLV